MGKFDRFESYSNTGRVNDYDHYVPQFLLKQFKIAGSSKNKPRILQYDFDSKSITDCRIKNVAGEVGYDAFKDISGVMSDYVSKQLFAETLELRGSFVIRLLNETDGEPTLTFLEESTLATFVAFQLTRVPAFFFAVERFILYLFEHKDIKKDDLGNKDFIESVIVKNSLGVSLENLQNHSPLVSIQGARNIIGLITREVAIFISEKIYRGYLHIINIPKGSNERFVISDNPVVLLDFERGEILKFPAWWEINKEKLWIFIPISPSRCIFFSKSRKMDGRVENNNTDLVQLVNFGQYLNATKNVFSENTNIINQHLRMYDKELSKLR